MEKDIRNTELYKKAEELYYNLQHPDPQQPERNQVSYASELQVSPNGDSAVFSGTFVERQDGMPYTRICHVDFNAGEVRTVTSGPSSDRLPKFAPNGMRIAFLSDRDQPGDFQLYLLDYDTGAITAAPRPEGWVEYHHWSPDGKRILLGVAGYGSDTAGVQGAVTSKKADENLPSWIPSVDTGDEAQQWRRAWVYELETGKLKPFSPVGCNIWEAVWCGNNAIAAVASPKPSEAQWYTACLQLINEGGDSRDIYTPQDQLGYPASSPSGQRVAIVEGLCSDRCVVAGDLVLIEADNDRISRIDTDQIDITYTEWRGEQTLLLAGHRGFESVICLYDVDTETLTEIWSSERPTIGGQYATVSGINDNGDCVFVAEDFVGFPEIAAIRQGDYQRIAMLCQGTPPVTTPLRCEKLYWQAPDGLEIQGWLLLPEGTGPYATVMYLHGGPVHFWRPQWLGLGHRLHLLLLVNQGYAVFLPNPRGSSGRGQTFSHLVLGDLGGDDALDCLSGVDYLVSHNIADPTRLGVAGHSYGGYMTSLLVTQDKRFTAAVSSGPMTNYVTEYFLSNISHFVKLFLGDDYSDPEGRYYSRSPIMYAGSVETPTLNVCGALDRCTPPEEATQFHNALLEHGVESALVIYPEEGHRIKKAPTTIDYATRITSWFEKHMPAKIE